MLRAMSPARWLSLAAAPTFAAMALVTGAQELRDGVVICSRLPGGSPLAGMAVMYLLMSVIHLAPWLPPSGGGRPSSQ